MIIGVSLKYYKTYSATNYIPLSNGQNFNGIVGNNGIGKSSILEALDCLFNNKEFNFNTNVRKSGEERTNPHIVPIFLIKKDSGIFSEKNIEIVEKYSEFVWGLKEEFLLSQNKDHFKLLKKQLDILVRDSFKESHYIIPLGINKERKIDISFFNVKRLAEALGHDIEAGKKIQQDKLDEYFEDVLLDLFKHYEYIYIPNDINPAVFTNLENQHIQSLMGKTLIEVIEKCVPRKEIQKINANLNVFLKELEEVLVEYSFRTSSDRQLMIRKANVYNLIIEDFFKTRKLHRKNDKHWLDVSLLSSGEKQKAIIDLTQHFLKKYRDKSDNIILAIDEPESSLHMSACYEQFNSLFQISEFCSQLIFSTHWYGFIPTVSNGNVTVITKNDLSKHQFDLISVSNYREEIKQEREKSRGVLPFDIRLKSLNDFVQSIITSILDDNSFNWILCEGSSEKKYFEFYFKDEIEGNNLRIIPVGGAAQIKKIYKNLLVSYEDFKNDVKGKVILLMDTDVSLVEFETKNNNHKNLKCFRLVNDDKSQKTKLVDVHQLPKTPKTEIEDVLCGATFFKALKLFSKDNDVSDFINSVDESKIDSNAVYYSLDLSPRKQKKLSEVFKKQDFKFAFAEKYISIIDESDVEPSWISELKEIISS